LRKAITKNAGTALVGEEPRILQGHEDTVHGVAFSPKDQLLATASADKTVRLWSLREPTEEPRILQGHANRIYAMTFSSDSSDEQVLATASADDTVRLWSVRDPSAEPRILRGHLDTVHGVAFSPDGHVLATASADDTVRLWSVVADDLKRIGCRLTTGNFSHEDWQLYLGDKLYNKTCPEHPLHPSFLKSIQEQVKSGDVKGGVARLYAALQVDSDSDDTLQKEAQRLAAPGLVDKGRELARGGEVDKAIGAFRQALRYDPTLMLEPRREAQRVAAAALVEKGQELARGDEVDKAIGAFRQARDLDPTLTLEPTTEARRLAAPALVDKGRKLAIQGEISKAMDAFSAAQKNDPNLEIDAYSWNFLCWFGSLWGSANDVMRACERAVELAPDDGGYRDSRGLARALTGNFPGAVEDFRQYLEWGPKNGQSEERIRQRQDWIRSLQADQNPFNEHALQPLFAQ
jgi:tetratricopeptide (TPR) repeat protein